MRAIFPPHPPAPRRGGGTIAAVTALGVLAAAAATAWASAGQDYEVATEKLANGDPRGAAEEFVALGERYPGESIAADALFSGARLFEERLGEPERAVELYRRIGERYPDSRVALAAARRLESLEALLVGDPSGAAVSAWKTILASAKPPGQEEGRSEAAARALIEAHPNWVGRVRVHLWLAERARARGALEIAAGELQQAQKTARSRADRYEAGRLYASVLAAQGDFKAANQELSKLDPGDDPVQAQLILGLRDRLALQHLRQQVRTACLAGIALALAALLASLRRTTGSVRAAAHELRRPPVEVWFALPIAVLLVGMALTAHRDTGPAVAIICSVGVILAWVSGAGLRHRFENQSRSWSVLLLHVFAVFVGVSCAIYVAIHHGQLIDEILDTVRFGPEV